MPTANDILQVIVNDLEAELAPLNSIYHNFAKFKVEAGFDSRSGFFLEVHAPDHVRIFIPTTYQSFPIKFIEWEAAKALDMSIAIDVSNHMHQIYD